MYSVEKKKNWFYWFEKKICLNESIDWKRDRLIYTIILFGFHIKCLSPRVNYFRTYIYICHFHGKILPKDQVKFYLNGSSHSLTRNEYVNVGICAHHTYMYHTIHGTNSISNRAHWCASASITVDAIMNDELISLHFELNISVVSLWCNWNIIIIRKLFCAGQNKKKMTFQIES